MFIVAIFILSLLIIWADRVAYNRYAARCSCGYLQWGIAALLVASNLLPYIAVAMMRLCNMPTMVPMMWLLTLYALLSLSRFGLYAGILLIKNRYAKWIVGLALCTIVAWVLLVGVVSTRKELTVKRAEIVSERLPKAFDGLERIK